MATDSILPHARTAGTWLAHRLDLVATAIICLPIVWAAARAAAGDWVPVGDDAYFTLRSLDVGTGHHPLLGAWSSASVDLDDSVNNLGPMQLDLLAPFTKVAPYGGTAIGVASVQVAVVVTIGWLLRRTVGARTAVAALIPVAVLCWTMGSELLITPRQHQFLVLPYLLVLVATWASAAGDRWAPTAFVAAGSLTVQTHLSYPVLVAALAVVVVAGQARAARHADDPGAYHRPWAVAIVTGLVLWVQSVIDQFFGWGNFGDVLTSPGDTERPGLWRALQIVGSVVGDPGRHLRGGYPTFDPDLAMSDVAATGVIAVVLGLVAALAGVWRRGWGVAAAGFGTALVAMVAAVIDAAMLPVTLFGLAAGNYRWLWSTVTFLAIGVCVAAYRRLAVRVRLPERRLKLAGVVVVAVIAAANLPRSVQTPRPERYVAEQAAVRGVVDQLAQLEFEGPVVIDQLGMYFGHPYGYPVALVVRERGGEFRFVAEMQERRFGADRVADGTEPTRLVLLANDEALAVAGEPDTVVFVDDFGPMAIVMERR